MVMQMVFGGIILASLYHYVKKGSKTARVILTAIACIGVLFGAVFLIGVISVPALAAIYAYGIFARIAIVVLVTTDPVNAIPPQQPPVTARPVSETHEHDWQPHAL